MFDPGIEADLARHHRQMDRAAGDEAITKLSDYHAVEVSRSGYRIFAYEEDSHDGLIIDLSRYGGDCVLLTADEIRKLLVLIAD